MLILAEHPLRHGDGGHRSRPPRVEGEVNDRLDEFGLGQPVLLGESQVADELFGAAVGHQGGDGDQ
jgi:hypothetical protein